MKRALIVAAGNTDGTEVSQKYDLENLKNIFKDSYENIKRNRKNHWLYFGIAICNTWCTFGIKNTYYETIIKDFYNNFVQFDSGYQYPPQLVFVCEDDKHIAEAFKAIVLNNVQITKIKL